MCDQVLALKLASWKVCKKLREFSDFHSSDTLSNISDGRLSKMLYYHLPLIITFTVNIGLFILIARKFYGSRKSSNDEKSNLMSYKYVTIEIILSNLSDGTFVVCFQNSSILTAFCCDGNSVDIRSDFIFNRTKSPSFLSNRYFKHITRRFYICSLHIE